MRTAPVTARSGARRRSRRPSVLRLLAAQVRYQTTILLRSPAGTFFAIVIPVMLLVALNFLQGGTRLHTRGGISFAQFFTPAMIAFAVMNACYITTITMTVIARDAGILKRLRGTPLPATAYIAGRSGASALVATVSVMMVALIGTLGYNVEVVVRTLPAVVLTVAAGIVCFNLVGLAMTSLVPSTDTALPVAYGTLLPLCFISNVFFPADAAPGWLSTVASVFPVRHLADALEAAFNPGLGGNGIAATDLGVLAAWAAGALAVTLLLFRWEPRPAGPGLRHRLAALVRRRRVPAAG